MATIRERRRRRTVAVDDVPDRERHPTEGLEPSDLADDVMSLLNSLGADVSSVAIYREDDGRPGDYAYLTNISADEFRAGGMELLKTQWGGGRYRLNIADSKQGAIPPVFISIDRRFPGRSLTVSDAARNPAVVHTGFDHDLLKLLITNMMTQRQQPSLDMPSLLQFSVQMIAAITAATRGSGGGNVSEAMAMMKEAMAFAREINPPERDLATTALEAFAPVAANLAANWKRDDTPSVASAQRVDQPAPQLPAQPLQPLSPPPAEVQVPGFRQYVDMYLPLLLNAAQSDSNPALYADMVVDQLDAHGALDRAYELLKTPDVARHNLRVLVPELWQPQYAAWMERCFDESVKAVRDAVEQPDVEHEQPPATPVTPPVSLSVPNGTANVTKPPAKRGKRSEVANG